MRKIILPFLVCISFHLIGQKSFFGVDAGVNVATQRIVTTYSPITLNSIYFFQNKIRPSFGIFYEYNFSDAIAMRANAQYMGMGYTSKGTSPDKLDINYLTFPISFHYFANKHLSLNAGSYVSFTIGGTKLNNEDITKTYHKNDFGLIIGAEHDLYKNFALGVNYFIGFKNIWLFDSTPGVNYKYTNRALQIKKQS